MNRFQWLRLMRLSLLTAAGILLHGRAGSCSRRCRGTRQSGSANGAGGGTGQEANTPAGKQLGAHDLASPEVAKESDEDLNRHSDQGR